MRNSLSGIAAGALLALAPILSHAQTTHVEIDTRKLAPGQRMETLPQMEQMARSFQNSADYNVWKGRQVPASSARTSDASAKQPQAAGQMKGGGGIGTCECWRTPDGSYTEVNN